MEADGRPCTAGALWGTFRNAHSGWRRLSTLSLEPGLDTAFVSSLHPNNAVHTLCAVADSPLYVQDTSPTHLDPLCCRPVQKRTAHRSLVQPTLAQTWSATPWSQRLATPQRSSCRSSNLRILRLQERVAWRYNNYSVLQAQRHLDLRKLEKCHASLASADRPS